MTGFSPERALRTLRDLSTTTRSALSKRALGARVLSVISRRPGKPDVEDEISIALLVYFLVLFGLLLCVHLLQPEREQSTGSSRSPTHQQEHTKK